MKCPNCGAVLEKDAKFCVVCGQPVPEEAPVQADGGYVPGDSSSYTPGSGAQDAYTPGSYTPGSYTPGGSENYGGTQGAYNPGSYTSGGSENYGGSGRRTTDVNTNHIREYFLGRKSRWPGILIVIGIVFCWTGIGFLLVLIGLIAILVEFLMSIFANFAHEDEVDAAWKKQKTVMRERGMEKLNLDRDQISLIPPLVLIGFGKSPDSSFANAREYSAKQSNKFGVFKALRNLIFGKRKDGTEYDPVLVKKIGSDGKIRAMLQEYTVYAFTENQVLVYSGDVDISTGLVYNEYTAECFYEDIEGIRLTESMYKVLNAKKRHYESKLTNEFVLYLGGCNFRCSVNNEVDSTVGDEQFGAMRNLIRDKKTV
ncbi:MAG: zinc-ribbon domain-containing protein [Clostridiales bacterium]|nr:zinc-ribbon domain-containing protein [Clostridiales bacterium]